MICHCYCPVLQPLSKNLKEIHQLGNKDFKIEMNFTIILLQSFSSTSILILFYFQWEIQFLFTFAFCLFYFVPDNYTNTERPAHITLQLDGSTQDHWIWWVALQSDGELVDVSARPFLVIFECQSCLQEGHWGECQGTTAEVSQLASICLKVMGKVFVESISKHRKNKAIVSSQHRFEGDKGRAENVVYTSNLVQPSIHLL